MLQDGATGVTPFGTTGEGASIAFDERSEAISALITSGIPPQAITLGLCASAIGDVALQVQQGIGFGITRFLLTPPFYFKGLEDAGLFDWHEQVFGAADDRATFILYHIPQMTNVPLSLELTRSLRSAFPDQVVAIKDSAGHWEDTRQLLESGEIPVLVGDERLLHKAAAMGAAGSICGMANLHPRRMRMLFDTHVEDNALSAEVDAIVAGPVIPALKQAIASKTGDASWRKHSPATACFAGQSTGGNQGKVSLEFCGSEGPVSLDTRTSAAARAPGRAQRSAPARPRSSTARKGNDLADDLAQRDAGDGVDDTTAKCRRAA